MLCGVLGVLGLISKLLKLATMLLFGGWSEEVEGAVWLTGLGVLAALATCA